MPERYLESERVLLVEICIKLITEESGKGEMPGHPWDSFLLLSRSNPAPFSSWMMVSDLGWSVASSSPEAGRARAGDSQNEADQGNQKERWELRGGPEAQRRNDL